MATVDTTIQVTRTEYPSLQVGDIAYYANTTSLGGFDKSDNLTKIGVIKNINNTSSLDDGTETTTLTCEIDTATPAPTTSSFIFFSKDNKVNLASLKGYQATVKFKNNSTARAEMYAASCEISESSK